MTAFKRVKSNNWVETDDAFGDFDVLGDGLSSKKRRINNTTLKTAAKVRSASTSESILPCESANITDELWSTRHSPKTVEELAINIKKVDEVKFWLKNVQNGGILLLTGPAGCGKTACLRVLARKLDIQVQEWVNPVEQVIFGDAGRGLAEDDRDRWIPGDTVTYTGKTGQFKDWLRSAKYSNVSSDSTCHSRKLILLEDFPSIAYNRNEEFLNTLQAFVGSRSQVTLVFIISDSTTSKKSSSVKEVLPPAWMEKMKAKTISFNPVTTTNLVKLLSRIAIFESQKGVRKFRMPEKTALENLAESVGGDVRAAINALQFSCLNEMKDLTEAFESINKLSSSKSSKAVSNSKQSKATVSSLSRIGGKDQSLEMFHALGKVLYAKRLDQPEQSVLPQILKKHKRMQLKCNPEEVLEKTTMSHDSFTCFLHHNYPPFYTSIDDVRRLSEYLSEADMFLKEWSTQGKISLTEYGGSVAARAVMFCNTSMTQNLGMRKLTKPEYYQAVRTERNRRYSLSSTFQTQSTKELVTCSLPLLAKIRPKVSATKMATITDVTTFPIKNIFSRVTTAVSDKNDVFSDDEGIEEDLLLKACYEDDEDMEAIEANGAVDEEEDFIIEEFDD